MIGKLQKKLPIVTDDPIELSSRVIDAGEHDERVNRTTQKLAVLDDDISIVESFSHIITFRTDDGLVCFDASGQITGEDAVTALRSWSDAPIDSLVYTHGHVDHVGGSGAMAADADRRGHRRIRVVGHEAVAARFDRYHLTNGYNTDINLRQFGGVGGVRSMAIGDVPQFLPDDVLWPDLEVGAAATLEVGGLTLEMHHAKGETDDHLWTWVPERRALCVGDFVTWVFPNCGNPQKVQRYPLEWAAALR
jgi:glyoxylase-like metal-dependent hydrolase (beta-lactamase superfamily II)